MICTGELERGKKLWLESSVRVPEGETFVGPDLAGAEHVLRVLHVGVRDHSWYWCYEHFCEVVDDQFEGMYEVVL